MKQSLFYCLMLSLLLSLGGIGCSTRNAQAPDWSKGELLFEDAGTGHWQDQWMLDGTRSSVINSEQGMELIAGPEYGNDTCHTVLWTKQAFQGDICIEYDYTRTDTATRCVNILYFHATGEGGAEFPTDISLWNDKRRVPHMRTYFNHMNTYHISYAAFPMKGDATEDYIRLRRYNPTQVGLAGTDIPGDQYNTGLFVPGITYHIQVLKRKGTIEMHVQDVRREQPPLHLIWDISDLPTYESGRIGLRHMYTRSARYQDFKVWRVK